MPAWHTSSPPEAAASPCAHAASAASKSSAQLLRAQPNFKAAIGELGITDHAQGFAAFSQPNTGLGGAHRVMDFGVMVGIAIAHGLTVPPPPTVTATGT